MPIYDIDNDGQGEYLFSWDPDQMILEVIDNENGKWIAKCYQLIKPPENPVETFLSAIGNFAFNVLPANVLAGLGTIGRIVGGVLGGIAQTIEAAVGLGIIVLVLVIIIILKR
jgi:hypothetical protein